MRMTFLFLLSAVALFATAAYQARIEAPQDMAQHALAPGVIEVETLQ